MAGCETPGKRKSSALQGFHRRIGPYRVVGPMDPIRSYSFLFPYSMCHCVRISSATEAEAAVTMLFHPMEKTSHVAGGPGDRPLPSSSDQWGLAPRLSANGQPDGLLGSLSPGYGEEDTIEQRLGEPDREACVSDQEQ